MSNVLGIKQLDVKNKRVILRVDFNVPIVEGKITDNSRIVKVLPTIKYLISQNARIYVMNYHAY